NDGNQCNGEESCAPDSGCVAGQPLQCGDLDVCNGEESCVPTIGCTPSTGPLQCDDGSPCTSDACDAVLGCIYLPNPQGCDDGDVCNGLETCDMALACVPGTQVGTCDDGVACTVDTCDPVGGCVSTPDNGQCVDGDPCDGTSVCTASGCQADVPLDCNDFDICTSDTCSAQGCAWQPVAACGGDTCDTPLTVGALPWSISLNTAGFSPNYGFAAGTCPGADQPIGGGLGTGAADMAFALTAAITGSYTVTLDAAFDAALVAGTGCGDPLQCTAATATGAGVQSLQLSLTQGAQIMLVVDGRNPAGGPDSSGSFTLDVSVSVENCDNLLDDDLDGDFDCLDADCALSPLCTDPGSGCDAPLVVGSAVLPATLSGDTSDQTNTMAVSSGDCPGASSLGSSAPEQVIALVAQETGLYRVAVVDASFDSALYAMTSCGDVDNTCLIADDTGIDSEDIEFVLTAGQTGYVVVDGWTSGSGTWEVLVTLEAETACGNGQDDDADGLSDCDDPDCLAECTPENCTSGIDDDGDGAVDCADSECFAAAECVAVGDTCASPTGFELDGGFPSVLVGDTSAYMPNYGYFGSCPGEFFSGAGGEGTGSRDIVVHFVAPLGGLYTFVLDADFDSALYAAADCADIEGTCLAANEAFSIETIELNLAAGQEVFVFVDGWSSSSDTNKGPFTLTVDRVVEICDSTTDEDQDGVIGCLDPDCQDHETCGEICDDGMPNDTDGLNDCADPECADSIACVPPGDSCDAAIIIDPGAAFPQVLSGDTTNLAPDYGYSSSSCPGDSSSAGGGAGTGSPDVVYRLDATVGGLYEFSVSTGWDAIIYAATDCSDINGTCLAADDAGNPETITLPLQAGDGVFVIVDGFSSSTFSTGSGAYELTVSRIVELCHTAVDEDGDGQVGCNDPDCAGSGACGEICDDNMPNDDDGLDDCLDPECDQFPTCFDPGDVCAAALPVVSLPFVGSLDTTGFANGYTSPSSCPGISSSQGGAAPDVVYVYTAPTSGQLNVVLEPSFDAVLTIATDCSDLQNTCLGSSDGVGDETLDLDVQAGVTYFVIIDGYSASADGTFTLSMDEAHEATCGNQADDDLDGLTDCDDPDCADSLICSGGGDTCELPVEVDPTALPFVSAGDTSEFSGNYGVSSACPGISGSMGGGSPEVVYAITPTANGALHALLEPSFDALLAVVTDCADTGSTCIAASDNVGDEEVSWAVEAGVTYFIMVDGYSDFSSLKGPFTLTIEEQQETDCGDGEDGDSDGLTDCADPDCDPATNCVVGGDTCADAIPIDAAALPWVDSFTTTGYANDYSAPDECPGTFGSLGGASPEMVFVLTPAAPGTYNVLLDPSFDSLLYAVTDCADMPTTCLEADDAIGSSDESLTLTLEANIPVFIIVDGYSNSSSLQGTFSLSVTGP
ncbi:MAG: hypothetical protein ACI9WU_004100, partial [Myxococcota bacterium]